MLGSEFKIRHKSITVIFAVCNSYSQSILTLNQNHRQQFHIRTQ